MSFISYAQNFEDVMLWRALGHIKKGFYIDIGAQHPVNDSVSKAFYEHGWRGIHVEPVPEFAALLRKDRPDETVLQVALADTEGILELNVIAETGLSTAVDAYAERHKLERGFAPQKLHVPVLTLKSAFSAYSGKEVHWLKIDVEGLEEKVLRGWDSKQLRPWIIVVEATIPNSTELNYSTWDKFLIDANYQFVYFDGLNRFYVANEHAELVKSFSSPPNVFDRFQLSGLSSSDLCHFVKTQYEIQLGAKDAEISAERAEKHAIHAQMRKLEEQEQESNQFFLLKQNALTQDLAEAEQRLGAKQTELAAAEQRLQIMQAEIRHLLERSQWLENEWNAAQLQVQTLGSELRSRSEELQQLRDSTSWRLTAPLRTLAKFGKLAPTLPGTLLRSTARAVMPVVRPVALSAIRTVLANPTMTGKALTLLNKAPRIKQKLRRSAVYAGLIKEQRAAIYTGLSAEALQPRVDESPLTIPHQQNLSASANRILVELQKANKRKDR